MIKIINTGSLGLVLICMISLSNAATVQISPLNSMVIVGGNFGVTVQGVDFAPTNGGGFTLIWDPAALMLVSTDLDISTELFSNGLGGNSVSITQGQLDIIRVVSPSVPLSGNFDISTLVFMAQPTGIGIPTDISFVATQPAWVDENNALLTSTLQPTYVGASIIITTPEGFIPIPAAVWLFCSGLFCLAGLARRKTHA